MPETSPSCKHCKRPLKEHHEIIRGVRPCPGVSTYYEPKQEKPKFVAVKEAVMRGSEHIGTMRSKTMAKRTANALNRYTPNDEGV